MNFESDYIKLGDMRPDVLVAALDRNGFATPWMKTGRSGSLGQARR